ncbi:Tudor domain-containing protein 7 [Zootermopsis nevadensis]|nr:Tudor domain-containing protein 7 [Zootermopsis nevadensis]
MAANPGNFTVQPYKDELRLEKMMVDMQIQYMQQKYSHPMPDSIHEGGLYAALHHDGYWYRVCVSNIISGSSVSVYFCDYGDLSILPLDKLQPLTSQFKELPYQAIKAKLAGIQPKHSDWSIEDCDMFQELVVEREFVSVIMETSPDLLNPTDMVIGLKLIDTSGKDDICIDELLISQDRAIRTM